MVDVSETIMIWIGREKPILASGSVTRRVLLESCGIDVEIRAPDIDERAIEHGLTGLSGIELAACLAQAKARATETTCPGRTIIAADQVLECEGRIFHKPTDKADAKLHLLALQGRTHCLHSSVMLLDEGEEYRLDDTARLTMRNLTGDQVDRYLDTIGSDRVCSSVGGYQVEGMGIHLFDKIEGAHSTILGLPLLPLLDRLRECKLLAF